ncbi:MAG: hypothetical protein WD626_00020, partial [Bauldia sp.]
MKTINEIRSDALTGLLTVGREITLAAVPDGMTGLAVVYLLRSSRGSRLLFVARDGQRWAEVERA